MHLLNYMNTDFMYVNEDVPAHTDSLLSCCEHITAGAVLPSSGYDEFLQWKVKVQISTVISI